MEKESGSHSFFKKCFIVSHILYKSLYNKIAEHVIRCVTCTLHYLGMFYSQFDLLFLHLNQYMCY